MREREEDEEAKGQDRVDTTFKLNVKGTTNFGSLTLIGRITSEAGPNTGQSLLHGQFKYYIDFAKNSIHRTLIIILIFDCVYMVARW